MPQVRPYRGIDAAERLAQRRARLIDAGLEILGAAPPARELTVRTICGGAGVAMRYFYESFTDREDFVRAVDATGLKPVIEHRYRFNELKQALEHLDRGAFGKIVLTRE